MTEQKARPDEAGAAAFGADALAQTPARTRRIRIERHELRPPQFYVTAPSPCPYLEGRMERKVFTHLAGSGAPALNDVLTQGGFRRSQNIAYRPACDACRSCVSVRVRVHDFEPTRSQRRVLRRNADLVSTGAAPSPSPEQYGLFRSYVEARHGGGGMVDMTVLDYAMMVEDTQVATQVVEYRRRRRLDEGGGPGELLGVALSDRLQDGLSMVYSFYAPAEDRRSLGTLMVLDHIRRARAEGVPYVYLGYWVPDSRKMGYKRQFRPQEHLAADGWVAVDPIAR